MERPIRGAVAAACLAAVAMLAGCDRNGWEGEAAARLETLAATRPDALHPWPGLELLREGDRLQLPGSDLLVETAERLAAGEDESVIAAGFHSTFADLAAQILETGPRLRTHPELVIS